MSNIKLLIADDEESIVESMEMYFTRRGYQVFTAQSGDEAIELYKNNRPDISLIDLHMIGSPNEGLRILEEIKNINDEAICIMLTRITKPETIEKSKELGALHYLLKPFKAKDLSEIIVRANDGYIIITNAGRLVIVCAGTKIDTLMKTVKVMRIAAKNLIKIFEGR